MTYTPERLAYWYFRLNGFLTTENFIVHPDMGANQRTDVDLLAVRFTHRAENLTSPMQDDPRVVDCRTCPNIIIAEIKTGRCDLNRTWTNPASKNMERVLRAVGCVHEQSLQQAANSLYRNGLWQNGAVSVRLFAIGEAKSQLLIPQNQQLTWSEIIQFIIDRFNDYRRQKTAVGQWTVDGKMLQRLARTNGEGAIRRLFNVLSNAVPVPDVTHSERSKLNRVISDVQSEMEKELVGLKQRRDKSRPQQQGVLQELVTGRGSHT